MVVLLATLFLLMQSCRTLVVDGHIRRYAARVCVRYVDTGSRHPAVNGRYLPVPVYVSEDHSPLAT